MVSRDSKSVVSEGSGEEGGDDSVEFSLDGVGDNGGFRD